MSKEKKKFSETKVGIFLKEKFPKILATVGDALPDRGMIGFIKNLISKDDSQSEETRLEALKLLNEHEEMYLKDVQNARDNEMKKDISENASWMSKNVHEIIAFSVVGGWIVTWYVKPTINPMDIKDMVVLILGYLYGRSTPQK